MKRGRNVATDGVAASSLTSVHMHTEPGVALEPAIKTEFHERRDLHAISLAPPSQPVDKKMKSEASEMVPSKAYLQMPSRDAELRMRLQSSKHKPFLSDKDYASSFCASSTAATVSAETRPTCKSPQFDEDEEKLLELKLAPSKGIGIVQEFGLDALMLPKSFMDLEATFEELLKILSTAHARGGKRGTPLESLKDDMLRLYHRPFRKEHLKQIIALAPDSIIVYHSWKDGKFCHRTVSINTSKLNLRPNQQVLHAKCLADMRASFRSSMVSYLRACHSEFLHANYPELKLDPDRIFQWHAEFDLSSVPLPTVELPPLPPAEAHHCVHSSIIKDQTVKITPEIEEAFEKYQSENMTVEKMKHIQDCSKSAIGLQNIQKIQKYELDQFALQQSYKVLDEKNAETIFRAAADALRGLFKQRNKVALPLADVLKTLHHSKGLTFKSDLDALEMVDQLVQKLPTFFSRKKYPTHGEMVRFPNADLFPWHQLRAYPQ